METQEVTRLSILSGMAQLLVEVLLSMAFLLEQLSKRVSMLKGLSPSKEMLMGLMSLQLPLLMIQRFKLHTCYNGNMSHLKIYCIKIGIGALSPLRGIHVSFPTSDTRVLPIQPMRSMPTASIC